MMAWLRRIEYLLSTNKMTNRTQRMAINITSRNILGFVLLFILVALEIQISLQQQCRLTQPKLESETGYALIGTEYTSFQTEHHALCLLECEKAERCMSLNYYTITSTCSLNTGTKQSHPERYEQRPDSIYFTNPVGRIPAMKGTKVLPAKSCLDVLNSGRSIGTGVYWLDPANIGIPTKAYCDMTTDGGGWTIIKKTVLQNTSPLHYEKVHFNEVFESYDRNDVNVLVLVQTMSEIHQKMGFHQIHFYCYKKSVGRVVSIMTKNNTAGQQVVQHFTEDTPIFPYACGSYENLPDDTSILAQNCEKWGKNEQSDVEIGKWGTYTFRGNKRLVARPFAMEGNNKHVFGCRDHNSEFFFLCDDSDSAIEPFNPGDTWQISVR